MPPKTTPPKDRTGVRGDEAEELVLQYMKQVNRPYASTDVSANLKNKVTKPAAQKILQSLADKGSLSIKTYGKQTIFVYNQDSLPTLATEALAELDTEIKSLMDDVDAARKKMRTLTTDIQNLLTMPKTGNIQSEIDRVKDENERTTNLLVPLRAATASSSDSQGEGSSSGGTGAGPMTNDEVNALEKDWQKWRKDWVKRRRTYAILLDVVQPEGNQADRAIFEESVGVEAETSEMKEIEDSSLCKPPSPVRLAGKGKPSGIGGSKGGGVAGSGDKRKRS